MISTHKFRALLVSVQQLRIHIPHHLDHPTRWIKLRQIYMQPPSLTHRGLLLAVQGYSVRGQRTPSTGLSRLVRHTPTWSLHEQLNSLQLLSRITCKPWSITIRSSA
jgi:hypothetical protein